MNDKHNQYLKDLRDSGKVNMWGASPYLARHFGMSEKVAGDILVEWIESFNPGGVNDPTNKETKI